VNWPPLLATLIAAALGFAAESALVLWGGASVHPAYLALCAVITFGIAVLVGGITSWWGGRTEVALAVWATLNGFYDFDDGGHLRFVMAIGFGLVTWACLRWTRSVRPSAMSVGVGVGATVVVTAIFLRHLVRLAMRTRIPDDVWGDLMHVGAFGGILFLYSLYSRLRRSRRQAPPEAAVAVALLIMAVAVGPAVQQAGRGPQPSEPAPTAAAEDGAALPSILVILLDTVRADHMSVYGYHRDTTPSLRRLLEENPQAVLYPLAFSPETWTLPSHASLFTGLLPSSHGVCGGEGRNVFRLLAGTQRLEADRTLAEVVAERGYCVGAVIANTSLGMFEGLARGFDFFYQPPPPRPLFLIGEGVRKRHAEWLVAEHVKPYSSSLDVNRELLRFIDGCGDRPWFVFANYMDAHAPYAPVRPYAGAFSEGVSGPPPIVTESGASTGRLRHAEMRYDEEILATDGALGELFHALEARGFLDRAWVVVTSDHGEAFGEHGVVGHWTSIYNEEIRIPLIVKPPVGESLAPDDGAVGLIDATATLAALATGETLGIGRDLRETPSNDPAVLAEFHPRWDATADQSPLPTTPARAVMAGRLKLIVYPDRRELYALDEDPEERVDLSESHPDDVERLLGLLPTLDLEFGSETEGELSPEVEARLRALGYVD
jgi:arylsulfatase A-like enzyme